jgi:uncharacterized membrane protein (DUF485 family)
MSKEGEPQEQHHDDHPDVITRNARYGLILFFIYLIIYGTFVALSAFAPSLMAKPVIGGVNLAVVYGLGLIGLAFVLALIYMALCRTDREGTA